MNIPSMQTVFRIKKKNIRKEVIKAENFPEAYNKFTNSLKDRESLSMGWLNWKRHALYNQSKK